MSQGLHNTLFVEYGLTKLLVPQLVDLREIVVGGAPPEPPPPPPPEGFDAVKALRNVVRGPASAPTPPGGLTAITTSDNFQSKINAGSVNEKFSVAPGSYPVANLSPKSGQEFYGLGLGVIFEGSGSLSQAISGSSGVSNVLWQGIEVRNYVEKCVYVNQGSAWRLHFMHMHNAGPSINRNSTLHLGANGGNSVFMSIITHGTDQAINAQAGGDTIDSNEVAFGNTSLTPWNTSGGANGGIKSHSAPGTLFIHNFFHNNFGPDVWYDNTPNDPGDRCVENLIDGAGTNTDGPGIMYETSAGTNLANQAILRGNVILNMTGGGDAAAYYISESQLVTIQDGLVEGCWGSLCGREGGRASNVDDMTFQDMVVDQRDLGVGQFPMAAGIINNDTPGTTNTWLRNQYVIAPSIAEPFRIDGNKVTVAEWRALYPTEVIVLA